MKIPIKQLKNGFTMPVFGMGTWQIGGAFARDPNNDDVADINAIQTAIEMGITHIDTAEVYADGYTEELVGQAIQGFDRSKLFLVSKVGKTHLRYHDLLATAEASLQRLKTEYLDLYLIHAPNPAIPIKETMKAMDKLVDNGFIKAIGVSNFTVERLEEAQSYATHKIVANQLHYNLIYREAEQKGVVKFCQTHDSMLIAYRPIQKGFLTQKGVPLLDQMCRKYNKTPSQIAINWLIAQPNVVTVSKMRMIAHIKENLGALGWEMEPKDVEKLRTEFPDQKDISNTVPLI